MATVTPRAAIAAGDGETSKVRTKPPIALTSATPGKPRKAGRMVKSRKLRCSVGVRLPPTMVNISISPSGVTIGARPPDTPEGRRSCTCARRSFTCARAQ